MFLSCFFPKKTSARSGKSQQVCDLEGALDDARQTIRDQRINMRNMESTAKGWENHCARLREQNKLLRGEVSNLSHQVDHLIMN
jgi:hypothetical protein